MKIETKYSCGDTVYWVNYYGTINGPLTIGQVNYTYTNSPGIEGEEIFANYMPQKSTEEHYMCVETGVGSGTIIPASSLFTSLEEAREEAAERKADLRS